MQLDSAVAQGQEIDLVALAKRLLAHKLLIFAITALTGVAAVIYALNATPIYRAELTVTDAPRDNFNVANGASSAGVGGLASLVGIKLPGGTASQEARAILNSRYLVEQFINRHGLLDQLREGMGVESKWSAVERFRTHALSIREDSRRGVITISVDWKDPVLAARWANDFMALANEIMRVRALNDATRNIEYLNEQLARTDVVEIRRVMYNLVEQETKTLMLANARAQYAFIIVDPAVPPEIRLSPRRKVIVAGTVFVGFLLGCLVALLYSIWLRRRGRA